MRAIAARRRVAQARQLSCKTKPGMIGASARPAILGLPNKAGSIAEATAIAMSNGVSSRGATRPPIATVAHARTNVEKFMGMLLILLDFRFGSPPQQPSHHVDMRLIFSTAFDKPFHLVRLDDVPNGFDMHVGSVFVMTTRSSSSGAFAVNSNSIAIGPRPGRCRTPSGTYSSTPGPRYCPLSASKTLDAERGSNRALMTPCADSH